MLSILSINRKHYLAIWAMIILAFSLSQAQAQSGRDILLPPGTDTVWHGVWLKPKRTIKGTAQIR